MLLLLLVLLRWQLGLKCRRGSIPLIVSAISTVTAPVVAQMTVLLVLWLWVWLSRMAVCVLRGMMRVA